MDYVNLLENKIIIGTELNWIVDEKSSRVCQDLMGCLQFTYYFIISYCYTGFWFSVLGSILCSFVHSFCAVYCISFLCTIDLYSFGFASIYLPTFFVICSYHKFTVLFTIQHTLGVALRIFIGSTNKYVVSLAYLYYLLQL